MSFILAGRPERRRGGDRQLGKGLKYFQMKQLTFYQISFFNLIFTTPNNIDYFYMYILWIWVSFVLVYAAVMGGGGGGLGD